MRHAAKVRARAFKRLLVTGLTGLIIGGGAVGLGQAPLYAQPLPQALVNRIPVSQPASLNLGYTSFLDGFGTNDPGWTYQSFLRYQRARSIKANDRRDVPAPANPRIDTVAWAHQFIYTSPYRIGSGNLGVSAIVPLVHTSATSDPLPFFPGTTLSDNGAGLGDVVAGAFIQFEPTIGRDRRPVFVHRLELDVIAPSGKYDANRSIQPGSNFWSINPYWAFTLLPTASWELSARVHYLYNFENKAPENAPPGVEITQAGQAVFVNFATSYEILPRLRIGLNGYYLRQIADSRVNGAHQSNTRALKLAFGPGLVWTYSMNDRFFVNYHVERTVANAPKSHALQVRWVHQFR